MGQVSSKLRRQTGGYAHWCPACEEMHTLPDWPWTFDGNLESPTFDPSFRHSGIKREFVNGKWTGEWPRDAEGKTIPFVCHYVLTAGILNFCQDCTHHMAGQSVALPDIPGSGVNVTAHYGGRGVEISIPDQDANEVLKQFFERNTD